MKSALGKMAMAIVALVGIAALFAGPAMAQYQTVVPAERPAGGFTDGGLGGSGNTFGFGSAGPSAGDAGAAGGAAGSGDEVLGTSQTPGGGLAVTGSTVALPAALGAGMIGAGSIVLLVARKRR